MTIQDQFIKRFSTLTLCAFGFLVANAQKLPNVQQKSLRAPATIKVDGKATEWDDTFQAYNHATDIYYSLANDDNNLYLVVQATDKQIINKIIGGGVQFTIQKSGKKNDKDGITITYPLFEAKDRPYVRAGGPANVTVFDGNGGVIGGRGNASAATVQRIEVRSDYSGKASAPAAMEGDSIMNVYNQRLDNGSKNIAVLGIPGLDTLISVYNEDGIKVGERFNTKMVYTVEIGIDLKKLGLSVGEASKFAYHIKLNGAPMGVQRVVINGQPGNASDPAVQEKVQAMMSQLRVSGIGGGDPTDFWGEYTLAKN